MLQPETNGCQGPAQPNGTESSQLLSLHHLFNDGICIRRDTTVRNIYICTVGQSFKQSPNRPVRFICTLQESAAGEEIASTEDETLEFNPAKCNALSLTYGGRRAILRPWDPNSCVIAAAIINKLLHFQVRPGSYVCTLGCSLQTLIHFADIIGPNGRLVGVVGDSMGPRKPTEAECTRFVQKYRWTSVIQADVETASFETYERLLSIPTASKYAFLMALHPRLGAESPARKLAEDAAKLGQLIFGFLECYDMARIKWLFICHWPVNTGVDVIRNVALSHLDIFQQWKSLRIQDPEVGVSGAVKREETESVDDDTSKEVEKPTTSGNEDLRGGSKKRSTGKKDSTTQWVFLDIPVDHITQETPRANMDEKLAEVVSSLKRMPTGQRTGLVAKEQLPLMPYWANRALLLMKYLSHRDERRKKTELLPEEDVAVLRNSGPSHEPKPDEQESTEAGGNMLSMPLAEGAIPMPSFGAFGGGSRHPAGGGPVPAPKQLAPAPAAPCPVPVGACGSSPTRGPPGLAGVPPPAPALRQPMMPPSPPPPPPPNPYHAEVGRGQQWQEGGHRGFDMRSMPWQNMPPPGHFTAAGAGPSATTGAARGGQAGLSPIRAALASQPGLDPALLTGPGDSPHPGSGNGRKLGSRATAGGSAAGRGSGAGSQGLMRVPTSQLGMQPASLQHSAHVASGYWDSGSPPMHGSNPQIPPAPGYWEDSGPPLQVGPQQYRMQAASNWGSDRGGDRQPMQDGVIPATPGLPPWWPTPVVMPGGGPTGWGAPSESAVVATTGAMAGAAAALAEDGLLRRPPPPEAPAPVGLGDAMPLPPFLLGAGTGGQDLQCISMSF